MYHKPESEKLPPSTALLNGLQAESFAIIKGCKVFEGRSVNLNDFFFFFWYFKNVFVAKII